MTDYQKDAENKGAEAARMLVNECNAMSMGKHVAAGFVEALCQEHRTLQQAFWRMMFMVIVEYGKRITPMWTDARNEASAKVCRKLTDVIEADGNGLPSL